MGKIDKSIIVFFIFTFISFLFILFILFLPKNIEVEIKNVHPIIVKSFFKNNSFIPSKYTCDGKNINPPLFLEGLNNLKNAKSILIIVEDPDAPTGTFIHWIAWNIPVKQIIEEGSSGKNYYEEGINDFGLKGYRGPCPPKGDKPHHYYFYVYVLNNTLNLNPNQKINILNLKLKIKNYVIGEGVLIGLYQRK